MRRPRRSWGARSVGLICPYLAYMRQDTRFKPGEGITSTYFANALGRHFDWLVTVDPHLHRHKSLPEIYTMPAAAAHAGPTISGAGTTDIIAVGIHGLFAGQAYDDLSVAGVQKIVTCNIVLHPSNAIDITALLAKTVEKLMRAQKGDGG
ncbi:MAG: hypothetical protein ACOY15_14725 [Pseudomonadota bacterium]